MPEPEDPLQRNRWQMRAGQRVNSRTRVVLEWKQGEEILRKEGYTLNVGVNGCLMVVPENLQVEQRLRLTNLANHQSIEAVVVWKGEERPEGWELGLQLLNPERDFWGLDCF
jgi:hypothetical protein